MSKTRVLHLALLTMTTSSLAAPAYAQSPAEMPPPPPEAQTPPPPPAAEPITTTTLPAPMAPMAMAKSPNDMTGSLGFGVGVTANPQLIGTSGQVSIKYWMKDTVALVPSLDFSLTKATNTPAGWNVAPQVVVLFVPFAATSTRFLIGGGLGFSVTKVSGAMDTGIGVNVPIQAGVEHFFARWFSMGIAAGTNLFSYQRLASTGNPWALAFSIDTASLLGSLFFYTD
jgi:hypothetical protein